MSYIISVSLLCIFTHTLNMIPQRNENSFICTFLFIGTSCLRLFFVLQKGIIFLRRMIYVDKILFLIMPLSKLARMFPFSNITKDFYLSVSLPFWEQIRENKFECNIHSDQIEFRNQNMTRGKGSALYNSRSVYRLI